MHYNAGQRFQAGLEIMVLNLGSTDDFQDYFSVLLRRKINHFMSLVRDLKMSLTNVKSVFLLTRKDYDSRKLKTAANVSRSGCPNRCNPLQKYSYIFLKFSLFSL